VARATSMAAAADEGMCALHPAALSRWHRRTWTHLFHE
jgi:hypothetical protein